MATVGVKRFNWMSRPAVVADDLPKLGLVLAVVRVAQHVFIVSVVRYVPVLRYKVHVEYPDVDSQSRLPVPVEVRRLCRVRHVVGRLQVAGAVQVLQEDIARRFHLHLYAQQQYTPLPRDNIRPFH